MEPMWRQLKRIIKPRGAIVLTASQPFTSRLVSSNYEMFKYSMVWVKNIATDFIRAGLKPLAKHEDVLVFSKGTVANCSPNLMNYYPQMQEGEYYLKKTVSLHKGNVVGIRPSHKDFIGNVSASDKRYPTTVMEFDKEAHHLHTSQKPLDLWQYLIKTYTQPGDLVFDPCVGSGTTAVAARNTGRDYICGDFTREYVELARERVQNSDPYRASVDKKTGVKQLSLFEASV